MTGAAAKRPKNAQRFSDRLLMVIRRLHVLHPKQVLQLLRENRKMKVRCKPILHGGTKYDGLACYYFPSESELTSCT